MGVAASIQHAERLHDEQFHSSIGDKRLDGSRLHDNSDSMRPSQRSVNKGSVRAMTLMNHAKQENSYMSVDELSSYYRRDGGRENEPGEKKRERKFRERKSTPDSTSSSSTNTSSISNSVGNDCTAETKPIFFGSDVKSAGPLDNSSLPSMTAFRANLQLKLQLDTPSACNSTVASINENFYANEHGVSEDENDDPAGLIELPSDEYSSSSSISNSNNSTISGGTDFNSPSKQVSNISISPQKASKANNGASS
jgi:hypothetical protein